MEPRRWVDAMRGMSQPVERDRAGIVHAVLASLGSATSADSVLWRARVDATVDVGPIVFAQADGPIIPRPDAAIEVWTDVELAALHALWWLVHDDEGDRADDRWMARLTRAVDWHLMHTQPDNATNRPWAVHVFALDGRDEAALYAQTLLHNARAQDGTLTALGKLLVADAAEAIASATTPRA